MKDSQTANLEMALALGLSASEYQHIVGQLNRDPNYAELGIFSAMFSEHCSYKSSKRFLKRFPTRGKHVLQGPGENAGVLDIGDGWAIAFKMESHNHPSFIEPYQGAATGVGGILRDIFTMGARPIANMDGLCFGDLTDQKTRSVVRGVVKGIGDYGNSVGVPTVAGQTFFHPCYTKNPLVNAFTVGILRHEDLFRGFASGVGNSLIYLGAKTGRDGVHGANMASKEFSTDKELERPTVQVGDPFTENLLLEASLEVMKAGLLVGIQDMGAAGLTSSSFEMAHRAGTGLKINLDSVPTRETGMTAFELLLSESQERMLLVAQPEKFPQIQEIFEKWDLHAEVIGEVTATPVVEMFFKGERVVELPVDLVVNPPMAERSIKVPSHLEDIWHLDEESLLSSPLQNKIDCLLSYPGFANPTPLTEQYDSMIGNRTLENTQADASVLRLRETGKKDLNLAITMDCNPRISFLWPYEGGVRAVAESALNLAVRGATPIGVTDCLNFGNPENPEVLWQFSESVSGIAKACEVLETPVVSGNVSLYNDTDKSPIYPTPMIGMVGLSDKLPPSRLFEPGLCLGLLGPLEGELGGSLLSSQFFKRECGKPSATDLEKVRKMVGTLTQLPKQSFQTVAHDISDGGLLVAALELVFQAQTNDTGLSLSLPKGISPDRFLFGETLPRILLAYRESEEGSVKNFFENQKHLFTRIGQFQQDPKLKIQFAEKTEFSLDLAPVRKNWDEKWKRFF